MSQPETPVLGGAPHLDAARTGEDNALDIAPTGADIRIVGQPLKLSEEATEGVVNKARELLPSLPRIPRWFWLLGAAFWGSLAYGAWRALKATAPVLVPAALGLPPEATMALRAAMQPSGAPPGSRPMPQLPPAAPRTSLDAISTTMSARGRRSGTADMLVQLAANGDLAGPAANVPGAGVSDARHPLSVEDAEGAPFGIVGLEQAMAPVSALLASRGRRSRTADAVATLGVPSASTPSAMDRVKEVVAWLREHPDTYTAAEVGKALGLDELTARGALKLAVDAGLLHAFKNGAVGAAGGAG